MFTRFREQSARLHGIRSIQKCLHVLRWKSIEHARASIEKAWACMRFHGAAANLGAVKWLILINSIAPIYFDKPRSPAAQVRESFKEIYIRPLTRVHRHQPRWHISPPSHWGCSITSHWSYRLISQSVTTMPATRSSTKPRREMQTSRQNAMCLDALVLGNCV